MSRHPNADWRWGNHPGLTKNTERHTPVGHLRPPCSHKGRSPLKYEITDQVTVWGGPEPESTWNLTNKLVLNLQEHRTKTQNSHFPIRNYGVPDDDDMFDALIEALCERAGNGQKIYIHCFAGHGRTGMVLGGMAGFLGIEDPVQHVRKNYCRRAIETPQQEFYVENYTDRSQ